MRVWRDPEKSRRFPSLLNWYMHRVSKKDLPLDALRQTTLDARRDALSCREIRVTDLYGLKKKGRIDICPDCGEASPAHQGGRCDACRVKGCCRSADV